MTVSTTTNKVRINGNGITTSFSFQFPILKNDFSDLKVYRIDIDEETQEEIATLLSITTNYTITVIKNLEQRITSGYINLINENNEPLALTENQALFIMREEEITQDLDLYENQKFPYKNLENMLDKIIVINQQQQEQIDRTLKTSSFFTGSLSETITSPVENRSLKWKKKQDGTFYVSNSDTDVDEVYNQIVNNPNVIAVGQNINNVNINANNINNVNTTANNINNVNNVAENINALNSINNWISTSGGVVNYYIGQVIQVLCSSNYIPFGTLPCDGTEYNKTQFPDLWNNYLIADTPLLQTCTYEEYQQDITTYGQCIKFAIDTINNKFKVPTIKDGSYITQAKSDTELGKSYNESLPNITATTGYLPNINSVNHPTGSMYLSGNTGSFNTGGSTNVNQTNIGFNASLSSSTYKNNAKVQGDNVRARFFVIVANGEINQSIMDWSAWATGLNGKANTDLNNLSAIGKETLDYIASPSNRILQLSLKASGTTYTATGNGWVYFFCKYQSGDSVFASGFNTNNSLGFHHFFNSNNSQDACRGSISCKKGDTFIISYNNTIKNVDFKFVYAEGSY